MKYIANLLVSIDQLGNVLAGGNPDNTISSRVGYYTEKHYTKDGVPVKWQVLKNIINFTFYPVDGEHHCKEAYYNDAGESFDKETKDWAIAVLTIIVVPSCLLISFLLYFLFAIKIVSPKDIDRTENVKKRMTSALGKLNGVLKELNDHKVKIDPELDNIMSDAESILYSINAKLSGMLNLNERLQRFKTKKREY